MTTAAAIDRLVHRSIIIELNLPSYRLEQAKSNIDGLENPTRRKDRTPKTKNEPLSSGKTPVQRALACRNHSGLIVKTRPGYGKTVRLPVGIAVHVRPGIAFTFLRNPQYIN